MIYYQPEKYACRYDANEYTGRDRYKILINKNQNNGSFQNRLFRNRYIREKNHNDKQDLGNHRMGGSRKNKAISKATRSHEIYFYKMECSFSLDGTFQIIFKNTNIDPNSPGLI